MSDQGIAQAPRPGVPSTWAWWPHTTKPGNAGFRLRCAQIIEQLQQRGASAVLYQPGSNRPPPSVLVLSKRYDSASLAHALALRDTHGTRLVLDLCDNHLHAEPDAPRWQARREQLLAALAAVDQVIVSSDALAEVVQAEARIRQQMAVIGDAAEPPHKPAPLARWRHPLDEWQLLRLQHWLAGQPGGKLVWFGQHGVPYASGGMADLAKLRPVLERLHAALPLSLTVISNHRPKFNTLTQGWRVPVHYLPWQPHTVSRALAMHDVAVIPITPNPFTFCKTNNRVATALLHGLAVVADSIPSYREFADCCCLDDWGAGFERLLREPAWRQSQVARGVDLIQSRWQLPQVVDQWQQVLTRLASK